MPHPVIDAGVYPQIMTSTGEKVPGELSMHSVTTAILSQEAISQHLSEELASIRGLLVEHHSDLLEKLESMLTQKVCPTIQIAPELSNVDATPDYAAADPMPLSPLSDVLEETQTKVSTGQKKTSHGSHHRKISLGQGQQNKQQETEEQSYVRSFVKSNLFEMVMGAIILLNVFVMAVHLQWKGYDAAVKLGLKDDDGSYARLQVVFEGVEKLFNAVYAVEMVLRMWSFKMAFFKSSFNIFELLIVVFTSLETFIFQALASGGTDVNLSILRILRIFHIFRVIRVMRVAQHFSELRILLRTLILSVRSVCWSFIMIGGIVLSAAILLVQMSLVFLHDESVNLERRHWLFNSFGTTSLALYTLIECTLSGGWRFFSRPMIEEVSLVFVVFWIPYVIFVNFTVMRIVAALFLKQTMTVAAIDDERLAMARVKEKERFASELRDIFEEADTSKDGAISAEEFATMVDNEHVMGHFAQLDLDLDEVSALFSVLSADDGVADYEEFLTGALKMKGSARTIDTVQILSQQLKLQRTLDAFSERIVGKTFSAPFSVDHSSAFDHGSV